jgi:5-methylcytosine-specific restriction endonuclease McrA
MTSINKRLVLLLNASFEPLRLIGVHRALTLLTKGKVVVELSTDILVYPGVYLPSVIRLREYARVPRQKQLVNKKNIYIRDGYTCQYCGTKFPSNQLTWDHVLPQSRGGKKEWTNLVTCCAKCNREKDDRTPEEAGMPLLRRILPETVHTGRHLLRLVALQLDEMRLWEPYLYINSEGDKRFHAYG